MIDRILGRSERLMAAAGCILLLGTVIVLAVVLWGSGAKERCELGGGHWVTRGEVAVPIMLGNVCTCSLVEEHSCEASK